LRFPAVGDFLFIWPIFTRREIMNYPTFPTRYAIYTRYSSDMQNEMSLEAQEDCCREAITKRGGVIVAVYRDSAKTGWSLDRDGFSSLRKAAEHKEFDAVMFWKFDRLARNHEHAMMIKMLLRHEYGLKLYCVEGYSEDNDDSPYTAILEQLFGIISAFYSKNLSDETKRGKRYRAVNGEFNGSIPPLGYTLVKEAEATSDRHAGLYIYPRLAAVVRRAFRLYATGNFTDANIATWLNDQPMIQQVRTNEHPIGKEMVRDMLQNRVYTGRVPYAETLYSGSLGEGRRSSRNRKEWFEGKHQGFISDELFEQCQAVRVQLTKYRKPTSQIRDYILNDKVYCARCIYRNQTDIKDTKYGKMRPGFSQRDGKAWYRCMCRDRGYGQCEQKYVSVNTIDEQVRQVIAHLSIPERFRESVETAIQERMEHADGVKRMKEIQEIVKRIDFRWEKGFMTPEEYIEKRSQLESELATLRPTEFSNLMVAADFLEHFTSYWEQCDRFDKPEQARQQLVEKIVDRVFVYDNEVIAIALHGNLGIVLNDIVSAPSEILKAVSKTMKRVETLR
jgi:site-specific DNA recombinase